MLSNFKSITMLVAQAINSANVSSSDLLALEAELGKRSNEVQTALQANKVSVDDAIRDGDLEKLRALRQEALDLEDERKVIGAKGSALRDQLVKVRGREALENAPKYRKQLEAAVQKARIAQVAIAECVEVAESLMQARITASKIGSELLFDADNIQALTMMIYPETSTQNGAPNLRKQAQIDLGLPEARRPLFAEPAPREEARPFRPAAYGTSGRN